MFTGIVQSIGRLLRREHRGADQRLLIAAGGVAVKGAVPGDSIAVNGVCLTVTELETRGFWADVSGETLSHTTLGRLADNAALNLEKSLTLSQPLGGHLMSGHVDGEGNVFKRAVDGRSVHLGVKAPAPLARYIARKGSIAVDGISLTVNAVDGRRFDLNIIPHTLAATNLGGIGEGAAVNLEVDLMARYLERLLTADTGGAKESDLARLLADRGFLFGEGREVR